MATLPFQVHDEDLGLVAAFQSLAEAMWYGDLRRKGLGASVLLLEVAPSSTRRWTFDGEAGIWRLEEA